ncbi:peptidylprolyl isomerase [Pontiella sulfatireligans]|uniref:Foldase protein PrsA 1 n=1 Tax=Pontiella sulfatireligans TaxID=2750658 RepID=A0A6C2UNZ1_9BACT|nr:peptidyl-prolyl cis-trans isomerase [Pontiella sulfatireligans]VGO20756.1 Foldase protein PrsA 1 [Pontiella sulfatireligans]
MSVHFSQKVIGVCSAAALLLGSSCSKQEAPAGLPADAVAMIGDRIIMPDDLAVEAERRMESGLPALAPAELLNRMMLRESMLMKSRETGLENDPEIQREIERLLVARLRDRELPALLDSVAVSEGEVEQAYRERIADFTTPALDRLAMLHLAIEKNASEAKRAEIRARMAEARRLAVEQRGSAALPLAKGFDQLSIQYSDDAVSRYRGGDLGWIDERKGLARIPDEVVQAAQRLPVGELSEIIAAGPGLFLVMRTDERPSTVKPFEQARPLLQKRLVAAKRDALEERYYMECLEAAGPRINQVVLATLAAPKEDAPVKFANGF